MNVSQITGGVYRVRACSKGHDRKSLQGQTDTFRNRTMQLLADQDDDIWRVFIYLYISQLQLQKWMQLDIAIKPT